MEAKRNRVLVAAIGLVVGLGLAAHGATRVGEPRGVAAKVDLGGAPMAQHGEAPASIRHYVDPGDTGVRRLAPAIRERAPESIRRAKERIMELLKGPFPIAEEDAVKIALRHAGLRDPVVVSVRRDFWQGDLRQGRVVYVVTLVERYHVDRCRGICPRAVVYVNARTGEVLRREMIV